MAQQQQIGAEEFTKPELTQVDIEEMKEWFHLFDKNGDKRLDRNELRKVCQAMCWSISDEEFDSNFNKYDADSNGYIEYNEYINFLQSLRKDPYREKCELLEAFRQFDKDRSGYMDEKELRRFLLTRDHTYTDKDRKQLNRLLKDADKNGDGKIDIEEFVDLMLEPPSQVAKY